MANHKENLAINVTDLPAIPNRHTLFPSEPGKSVYKHTSASPQTITSESESKEKSFWRIYRISGKIFEAKSLPKQGFCYLNTLTLCR